MIPALKPYPKMKDSGVKWLGEVPDHWKLERLSRAADFRVSSVDKKSNEGEVPVQLCNYVDVYKHDHIDRSISFMRATATPSELNRFKLQANDVLITKDSEAWNDIGVPALVADPHEDLVSGYHLAMLRPIPGYLMGGFLFRALQSTSLAYQFHVEAKGVTRFGLSHAGVKSAKLPIPPLPEQAAIVRFLGHYDRRIRRLIRAKQKLIKLLKEQKQAIIHQAVTGQIDVRTGKPYPAYKDSGVEWLGKVPVGWEVRRLKYIADGIQMGPFGASLTELIAHDTGYKLFGQENTISGDFSKGRRWVTAEQFSALQRYELSPGDLVLTRKGSIGNCKMVPEDASPGISDSDTIRVRLNTEKVSGRLVVLLLQEASYVQRQIRSMQRGAILAGLNTATISNLRLAVPPISYQSGLLAEVDARAAVVSNAISEAEREIELLGEYRTRLIADVVTGNLDVREAAQGLPDEVEELVEEDVDGPGRYVPVDDVLVDDV